MVEKKNQNFEVHFTAVLHEKFQVVWYPEGKDEIILERNVSFFDCTFF